MLTLEEKTEILQLAHDVSDYWWVDILDCSKSIYRQRIYMPFSDILLKLNNESHFTIIHRKTSGENHVEFGFSTMGSGPSYFLWINLSLDKANKLLKQFGLKITENKSIYPVY
jgi:hypothetical protein